MTANAYSKMLIIGAMTLWSAQAMAADAIKTAATRVATCVQKRDVTSCRENITASSIELFDRFTDYDLLDCLPQTASYLSSKADGKTMQVKANITTGQTKSTIRLTFQMEEDKWKLDIPETLRRGIGERWEGQLKATEQVYLMLRSQMGDNLNCSMIRNLGSGLSTSKAP